MAVYEELKVNLSEATSKALREAAQLTGDSLTDTINRAIQVYKHLMEAEARGGTLMVHEKGEVFTLSFD